MMSIAFKEGVKMSPQALNEVIAASGHDIRQVIVSDFCPLMLPSNFENSTCRLET